MLSGGGGATNGAGVRITNEKAAQVLRRIRLATPSQASATPTSPAATAVKPTEGVRRLGFCLRRDEE